MTTEPAVNLTKARSMHVGRCLLLVAIVLLINYQHRRTRLAAREAVTSPSIAVVQKIFAGANSLQINDDQDVWDVRGGDKTLGYVIQTSPKADDIVGFSGPTNILIGFAPDETITGLAIVSSEDTRDHVESVVEDPGYLSSLNGMAKDEAITADIDAVSGATLTCIAIQQSVRKRLGGVVTRGKFSEALTLKDVRTLFENADRFDSAADGLKSVFAGEDKIGSVLRTSPEADTEIGYQGPNDAIVGFSPDGKIIGISLLRSFDNEPYVRYVREDWGFPSRFNDLTISELSTLDLEAAEIEGVAGATMTSLGVANAMIRAAKVSLEPKPDPVRAGQSKFSVDARDIGTIIVTIFGLALGLKSLRGNRRLRLAFQFVLIGYLGLINGDMLSQALLVGFAKSGVAGSKAIGLVALSVAAFFVPVTTGRNVYCSNLCPHGAVQQLVRNRLPWKVRLSKRVTRGLSLIPGLLLLWVVIVAMGGVAFSLVDIEPFDAWLFRVAGVATIVIAIVGLIASMFVPMAYCRFGCPTGALLNYVRVNRRSGDFTARDGLALMALAIAGAIFLLGA